MVDQAVPILPGTVIGFAGVRLTARAKPQHGWRGLATRSLLLHQALAWRRHYDKTIRAINRAQRQP